VCPNPNPNPKKIFISIQFYMKRPMAN